MYSNDPELRNVQQVVLEIAQYFVVFVINTTYFVIFVVVAVLALSVIKVLFLGMMTWIFLCLDKIMKK